MKQRYDSPDPTRKTGKGDLGELLDGRNQSLLAHGTTPLSQQRTAEMYGEVESTLAQHLQGENLQLDDPSPTPSSSKTRRWGGCRRHGYLSRNSLSAQVRGD
jgi:hypothetical protein